MDKLGKDKVMRPSLIDSIDKINEIVDVVNGVDNPFTFTPYSGFTTLSAFSKRFGNIIVYSVEVQTATARPVGAVAVGKFNTTIGGLGAARILNSSDTLIAGGTAQIAGNGEVRFFHQVPNAIKFWAYVIAVN